MVESLATALIHTFNEAFIVFETTRRSGLGSHSGEYSGSYILDADLMIIVQVLYAYTYWLEQLRTVYLFFLE